MNLGRSLGSWSWFAKIHSVASASVWKESEEALITFCDISGMGGVLYGFWFFNRWGVLVFALLVFLVGFSGFMCYLGFLFPYSVFGM